MKLARGPVPLYYQIAQILRSQIQVHEFKVKDLLPTEDEIIRTFEVSRTTVRQALQILLNEGLIYRIPGKGTFVAERPKTPREFLAGSIEEIISSNYATKLEIISRENVEAHQELAKNLRIQTGTVVTQLCGLRSVDGEPFFYFTLYAPTDIAEKIVPTGDEPIMALVERYCDVQVREARQWTAASLAGSDVAHHLRIKLGDPVLLVERHYTGADGRVVAVGVDRYRTDRIRLYLRLTRSIPAVAASSGNFAQ